MHDVTSIEFKVTGETGQEIEEEVHRLLVSFIGEERTRRADVKIITHKLAEDKAKGESLWEADVTAVTSTEDPPLP